MNTDPLPPPESFICPITLVVMKEPVCDKEGNSFERSAITEWIGRHGCSPITRSPMTLEDLIPNRALKTMIEEHYQCPQVPFQCQGGGQPEVSERSRSLTGNTQENSKLSITTVLQNSKVLVTINPGDSLVRSPVNVACVIDISGSMGTEAQVPGDTSGKEACGLNILDVVKHAVVTIIKSLTAQDSLAIVAFSTSAEVVLPLTKMDLAGQTLAISNVNSLQPTNSTNLWAGLEKGLDVLVEVNKMTAGSISTVLLFTDGEPNVIPPRGHIPMLQMYKDSHGGVLPGLVNTFGFGYGLDSQLLYDLAREGNGIYGFIPDSGMVGTIFVNAVANLISTVATDCQLTIEPVGGATIVNPASTLRQYLVTEGKWGVLANVGSIQAGQSKDIVLEFQNLPPEGTEFMRITLGAKTRSYPTFKLSMTCNVENYQSQMPHPKLLHAAERFKLIGVIQSVMNIMKDATGDPEKIKDASQLVTAAIQATKAACGGSEMPLEVTALIADLEGQVLESLQPAYYTKWGRHYLPSLMMAHLYQVCNNFKDPGPQVYGGSLFKKLRDEADTLFLSLPPPKPSIKRATNQPVNMSRYYNSRGVCFHGDNQLQMGDGGMKAVDAVRKGDKVKSANGQITEVVCVVQTITGEEEHDLVHCPQSGLLVTPWHPIREVKGQWLFPIALDLPRKVECKILYNFVLNGGHVVEINGMECTTLGHSFTDEICAHEYFGSDLVVKDLQNMEGYEQGVVKVSGVIRNSKTHRIVGLIQHEE